MCKVLEGRHKLLSLVVDEACLRAFKELEEKVCLVLLGAAGIQDIKEAYLDEIILLLGVVSEKEILPEEFLHDISVHIGQVLVDLKQLFLRYLILVLDQPDFLDDMIDWNFSQPQLGLLSGELQQDPVDIIHLAVDRV